eukprot:jgi/Mesvir1/10778/Mv13837-RA.2
MALSQLARFAVPAHQLLVRSSHAVLVGGCSHSEGKRNGGGHILGLGYAAAVTGLLGHGSAVSADSSKSPGVTASQESGLGVRQGTNIGESASQAAKSHDSEGLCGADGPCTSGSGAPAHQQDTPVSNMHTARWRVFTDMGKDMFSQGRLPEAEEYLLKAVEESKAGFGENAPHVASSLNNLAELYRLMRDYERAEPLYLECLVRMEAAMGPAHASVGTALHNLASLYLLKGDVPKAREAYEVKQDSVGQGHPEYASTLFHLAEVVRLQGSGEDALPLMKRSITILEELGAGLTPICIKRMGRYAEMLFHHHKLEEAELVQRKMLQTAEITMGPSSGATATIASNLGITLHALRKLKEAHEVLSRAKEARLQAGGSPDAFLLAWDLYRLAAVEVDLAGVPGVTPFSGARDSSRRVAQRVMQQLEQRQQRAPGAPGTPAASGPGPGWQHATESSAVAASYADMVQRSSWLEIAYAHLQEALDQVASDDTKLLAKFDTPAHVERDRGSAAGAPGSDPRGQPLARQPGDTLTVGREAVPLPSAKSAVGQGADKSRTIFLTAFRVRVLLALGEVAELMRTYTPDQAVPTLQETEGWYRKALRDLDQVPGDVLDAPELRWLRWTVLACIASLLRSAMKSTSSLQAMKAGHEQGWPSDKELTVLEERAQQILHALQSSSQQA